MSVPRLYVPGLDPAAVRVELPDGEAHHVSRVLRLRAGDDVRVFDGRGREFAARLVPSDRRAAPVVEIIAAVSAVPEPLMRVALAAGILKGDHMDTVVRDATMMGVAEIVPLVSAHVTVSPKAWQGGAARERWQRVAIASVKQCGRAVVPDIADPLELASVLARRDGARIAMFVEPSSGQAGSPVSALTLDPGAPLLVLVGPEGGWSHQELHLARDAGAQLIHLGPRTIRADAMAAIAMAAVWAAAEFQSAPSNKR